ncbi:MAG TPA: prepilin-type N-terminal cleavage/methylation domain-containing protein [Verrucomicrobiae bacterium]|nr:prepilin-type N-terminal cleavage/methylation domain-containing protein [Verrucomicrobiae bacterium]
MRTPRSQGAFTLIEIMVAIAIVAILLTIGIPFIRMAIDTPQGINGAVRLVEDACRDARAKAILDHASVDLVIRPGDRSFSISGAPATSSSDRSLSPDVSGEEWRMPERSSGKPSSKVEFKRKYPASLPQSIEIEGLGVNGEDWTEDDEARVRFYADGTSDAMSIVLKSDENDRRNIWLEVVTGLPEVESDPQRFRHR